MSSNWTVVVHKKWSHRSFSLSLSLVGVGDILQSDRRYVCSGVSPSLSLRSRYVVVRVWCVGGGGGALFFFFVFFLSRLFFLLFVQKLDWKKLHEKIFINCARTFEDDDDDAQKTHKNDIGREGGRDDVVVRRLRFGGGGCVFSGGKRRPFFDDDDKTQQYE